MNSMGKNVNVHERPNLNWILETLELRIYSIDRSILNPIKLSPSVVRSLIVVDRGSLPWFP